MLSISPVLQLPIGFGLGVVSSVFPGLLRPFVMVGNRSAGYSRFFALSGRWLRCARHRSGLGAIADRERCLRNSGPRSRPLEQRAHVRPIVII